MGEKLQNPEAPKPSASADMTSIAEALTEIRIEGQLNKKFNSLANSNKFQPLKDKIKEPEELKDHRERDIETNKKLLKDLTSRILEKRKAERWSDIEELALTDPETAADLGKIDQAIEIIQIHKNGLSRISASERKMKQILDEARRWVEEEAKNPINYVKDDLQKALSPDELSRFKEFFHQVELLKTDFTWTG